MSLDYCDAANRHWEDANYLLNDDRFANADQLFGLSAECALKAVMLPLGMQLKPNGVPVDKRHGHIDKLWDEFETFVETRGGAGYAAILTSQSNPFANSWMVDQRYHARSTILKHTVNNHHNGAKLAKICLDMAILDGIVL